MSTSSPETLTKPPEIPKEIGEDRGQFYRYYDELAEESDEELVKSLKAQLDGILIFAGLFAGVNSAFLALTLPQMSASPADDTNALLLQIALGGNSSITSAADLPSASFTPPPRIYPINALFSVSLTLALLSSFLSVLGQQWLVYYRKRVSGGPEYQRWERLRRYLGAKRWQLELVLDDLVPSLLQLGLAIFCIAFALYLGTLSQSLNRIITWLLCAAGATIIAMSASSAFDPWCPFKLPLLQMARRLVSAIAAAVVWIGWSGGAVVVVVSAHLINAIRKARRCFLSRNLTERRMDSPIIIKSLPKLVETGSILFIQVYRWCMSAEIRSTGNPDDLKLKAIRRMICTSENRNALTYAAANLRAIRDVRILSPLRKDEEFWTRLSGLAKAALDETRHRQTRSCHSRVESLLLSTSFFHVMFSACSDPFVLFGGGLHASERLNISSDQMNRLHEASVVAVDTSCDGSFQSAALLFTIRVTYSIATPAQAYVLRDLDSAFESVGRISAGTADLRLGFIISSVILLSKRLRSESSTDPMVDRSSESLKILFAAYRETSERRMLETTSRALASMSTGWRRKLGHEIYVLLFEICLSHRGEVSTSDQHVVLGRVDDHVLSIEHWIRDNNISDTDIQHARDYQNRYVQSVADFLLAHKDSSRDTWSLVGRPMTRYLESVTKLMEAEPGHPENPRTMAILRRVRAVFPGPSSLGYPEYGPYSRFCQLLDQVELARAREVYQDLGLRYQRLSCIQQRGEMRCSQQEPPIHMLAL